MKNFNIYSTLLIVSFLLAICNTSFAQNKVVVIPLGDEPATATSKTLHFPPASLSTSLDLETTGIRVPDELTPMTLSLKQPADWDGVSDIELEILILGGGSGNVEFFVRPRDFNDGDVHLDTTGISANPTTFTENLQYREVSVSIPAAELPKDWWQLVIQRDSSDTNTVSLVLVAVALTYTTS